MRISAQEHQLISRLVQELDPDALVYLHGSRAQDAALGGDIDLLILSNSIDFMAKLDLLGRLHQALGERRIDIAIYQDPSLPFPRLAIATGVRL